MKGIITKKAYNGKRWVIVKAEDGAEYFIGNYGFAKPKQYNRYSWVGNMVVFDKDELGDFRIPHGRNAIFAEILDPNREQKRLNYEAHERARMENEEKRRVNRERQELLKKRADQRREYEARNTWYEIQYYSVAGWKAVHRRGLPVRFRGMEEAKKELAKIRLLDPLKSKYRLKKNIGLSITV